MLQLLKEATLARAKEKARKERAAEGQVPQTRGKRGSTLANEMTV